MSYDGKSEIVFATGALTLTADKIFDFDIGSEGRWRIVDIMYRVSTTFAGATRTPGIKAGSTVNDALLIDDYQFGLLANGNTVRSLRKSVPSIWNDGALNGKKVLENGDTLRLSILAATGGGAAGVAEFWIILQRDGGADR